MFHKNRVRLVTQHAKEMNFHLSSFITRTVFRVFLDNFSTFFHRCEIFFKQMVENLYDKKLSQSNVGNFKLAKLMDFFKVL